MEIWRPRARQDRSDMPPEPRVAVFGAGYWGKNIVRNFAELGALAGVVEPDAKGAEDICARYGGPRLSIEEALADTSIVGVAIASPAALHCELAKAALLAGKHTFVEKPLALTLSEASELV